MLGDASDPDVLLAAGGSGADALIAVTRDDATNLVAATLARHRLGARWMVARMNDPAHAWLFGPEAGVDVVVSTAELVARLVQEEVTAGDLVTLLRLRGAGIAVTETTLPPGASAAGTLAAELALPEGTGLTAVVRDGHVLLPDARVGCPPETSSSRSASPAGSTCCTTRSWDLPLSSPPHPHRGQATMCWAPARPTVTP